MRAWILNKCKKPLRMEFRSKPSWQRLIIMLGGVTVNLICILNLHDDFIVWGKKYASK